ncbi:MAG: hypothetical protein J0L57_00865 [Burkholderiales bacterium]|nr:hypothetical protein [Burkholderiales bacterium]
MAAHRPRCCALAVAGLLAAAARAAAPGADDARPAVLSVAPAAPGAYDAEFCVAQAPAPPSCGPVAAEVRGGGRVQVRIADIVYRLDPWGDRLGITLMHGTMQIDGFFAPYRWQGRTLQFEDTEKATRYELKLGARRFD